MELVDGLIKELIQVYFQDNYDISTVNSISKIMIKN